MVMTLMIISLTIGSAVFQIGAYRALPLYVHFWKWEIPIRAFIQKRPLVGLIINYALSLSIAQFFGSGMIAGAANLVGSMIFALYMFIESRLQGRFPKVFNS